MRSLRAKLRSPRSPCGPQAVAIGSDAVLHLATSTNDQGGKKAGRVLTKWKSTFYHAFSGRKRKYLHMSSGPAGAVCVLVLMQGFRGPPHYRVISGFL